jgi:hypothetical protein
MRGGDKRTGELFSSVDLEKRARSGHPLRAIRGLVNEALVALEHEFSALYAPIGRPSNDTKLRPHINSASTCEGALDRVERCQRNGAVMPAHAPGRAFAGPGTRRRPRSNEKQPYVAP